MIRTRFAPSPTGPLHLGHAFSAMTAFRLAQALEGEFHVRMEDLDQSRSRDHWEAQMYDDMAWLGLTWAQPVIRQSERGAAYKNALQKLWDLGLIYPCDCTRRDIAQAVSAPQHGAPLSGPHGVIYPGTCRHKPKPTQMPENMALRLDMELAHAPGRSFIQVDGMGIETANTVVAAPHTQRHIGDPVISRKGLDAAYHLAVVVDDAFSGITHVVRGADLFEATKIHVLLQSALDLPTPKYHHHRLMTDEHGKRLAKRDDARAIAAYRKDGLSPSDVLMLVGLQASGPKSSSGWSPRMDV